MGPIRALIAFAAALIAPVAGALAQTPPAPAVTSAGPASVSVTIYRETSSGSDRPLNLGWLTGYALITETRTVTIPAGRSTIRFEGVAGGILPESAIVSGLPDGVLEKNLDADLLSPRTLYARSYGRPVILRRIDDRGQTIEERGIIRSGPDGAAIIQTHDGFIAADCNFGRESLVYETVPAGLSAKPTLSIETNSPDARQVTISLSYLAWGFDWQANYVATMRPDGKTADLTAWVTLANGDVTGFADAETMVVAGSVNRDGERQGRTGLETAGALQFRCLARVLPPAIVDSVSAEDMGSLPDRNVSEALQRVPGVQMTAAPVSVVRVEDLGDLKLFRVPHRTTVAAHSIKQVALFAQKTVPVEIIHTAAVFPQGPYSNPRVVMTLRFQNRREDGLGIALPGGMLALFEPAGGERLLIGEARMANYADGEEVELQVAQSTQVNLRWGAAPERGSRDRMLIATNANPYPVRLEASFYWPDGKRVRASARLGQRHGRPLWAVEVPANSSVSLRVRN